MIDISALTRKLLRERLAELYPGQEYELFYFCLTSNQVPFGYSHPDMILDLVAPNTPIDDNLRLFYVFLCSYYFLLDAAVDGHLPTRTSIVTLTPLLHLAINALERITHSHAPLRPLLQDGAFLSSYISRNSSAVRDEICFQSTPLVVDESVEYESIVNRSNCFFLLYQLATLLTQRPYCLHTVALLKHYTFYVQLADDLGDWRMDYQKQNYTSFLRQCFVDCGRLLSLDELEEYIYLKGKYETRLLHLISSCKQLINKLRSCTERSDTYFERAIRREQDNLLGLLTQFQNTKKRFLKRHG